MFMRSLWEFLEILSELNGSWQHDRQMLSKLLTSKISMNFLQLMPVLLSVCLLSCCISLSLILLGLLHITILCSMHVIADNDIPCLHYGLSLCSMMANKSRLMEAYFWTAIMAEARVPDHCLHRHLDISIPTIHWTFDSVIWCILCFLRPYWYHISLTWVQSFRTLHKLLAFSMGVLKLCTLQSSI